MHRVLLLLGVLLGPVLCAQGPSADWRTAKTPHFRVHYPRAYEEWALRATSHLESIREDVAREAGFTPPQTVDVIVMNPVAEPNGIAWPLLDGPRMILYAEPPGPDEQLGAYRHWIDLLTIHETTHLVHMLRPSRDPFTRLLPLNPITLRAPRWVLEGYATVIEGRLTGAGRPNSTIRALILRRWAETGRLPSYAQLTSDRRFLGTSMAYLMGSAFLEWLESRGGPDSLRHLWSRMTARQRRSFASAFTGVFGESPDRMYGMFLAELTASAIVIDRSAVFREGELFQETSWSSGSPAVSPDGTKIAIVIRMRDQPDKLVVWSTAPAEAEEKKFSERIEKILARDPEDVPPVRVKPLPRDPLHTLVLMDGGDIETPRWTRDGKTILFSHRVPDAEGVLHFDLFRWDLQSVERVTHLADVRDADPFPDGATAVAVRNRFGASQLVTVSLSTGAVSEGTPASIDVVETHPRVSPDGAHVAHVAHRDGRWALQIDDDVVPVDGDSATPEWTSDGDLVFSVFTRGFAELHSMRNGAITRTHGGAFQPAPSPDGRVFFMSLDPGGYVLRALPSVERAPALPLLDAALVPAIPPASPVVPAAARAAAAPAGGPPAFRLETSFIAGGYYVPGDHSFEAGVRIGDVLGRFDALLLGSTGEGAALAATWRGWPVALGMHLYEDGVEARVSWSRRFPRSTLWLDAGTLSRRFAFASAAFRTTQVLGTSRFEEAARADVDGAHYRGVVSGSWRAGSLRVSARYQHDGGEPLALGGIASSIKPRSAYARQILDPALPVAHPAGERYDGLRIETTVPSMPFTAFYQRHDLDGSATALAGVRFEVSTTPNPILRFPALDLTAGAARILDGPLRGDTNWWLGVRWRP